MYFFDSLRNCVSQQASASGVDTKTMVDIHRVVHLNPKPVIGCFALNRKRHPYPQIQVQVADAFDIFCGQLNVGSVQVLNQSAVDGTLGDDCEISRQRPSQEDLSLSYKSHSSNRFRSDDSAAYSSIVSWRY